MPAPERPLYLSTTAQLIPDELLSVHLSSWRGPELRPLIRQRLAGLMRAEVESVSLNDEGILRVALSGDAVIAQLALRDELQAYSGDVLFIYCDLREAFDLPDDIEQMLSDRLILWDQPLHQALVDWLLDELKEPEVCVELGLVSESANAVFEAYLEQRELLTRQDKAIALLSSFCETLAAAAARAPEADLQRRVIEALQSQPPQGMVDGEANYWEEINGFTYDIDEMPPKAVEDIRGLAGHLVYALPDDLRLALEVADLSVHEWIMEKIEDDEVPIHRGQVDFDGDGLGEQVAMRVLDQALNFDPAIQQVSHDEAEALCLAVIEGRQDLWASDLAERLIAVGSTFPGMALFEQAAHVYADYMVKVAQRVLNRTD